jgi:hypothetical protein
VKVANQIAVLNRMNAEYCAILSKLNQIDHLLGRSIVGKAEMMRSDIRDKIKHLSTNVDLMY